MASGQEPVPPPSAQRGTSDGGRGGSTQVSTQRHSDINNGTRPKYGVLELRENGSLAPEGPVGDPTTAGIQGCRDNPKNTTGTGDSNRMETGTGQQNRQCASPSVHVHPVEEDTEPPKWQRVINACIQQGGGSLRSVRLPCAAKGQRGTPRYGGGNPHCASRRRGGGWTSQAATHASRLRI